MQKIYYMCFMRRLYNLAMLIIIQKDYMRRLKMLYTLLLLVTGVFILFYTSGVLKPPHKNLINLFKKENITVSYIISKQKEKGCRSRSNRNPFIHNIKRGLFKNKNYLGSISCCVS